MFSYERSVGYPGKATEDGFRQRTAIRPLPSL